MKIFKLLCLTFVIVLINCQNAEVKADISLTSTNANVSVTSSNNSSGASAGCWSTTLQGKCNKQRMLFSKFKVDDQESICSLFVLKEDGCHFKADAASVEKLNSLKDEALNKLTSAVNKYVSEKFIKIQAKVLKTQEKNASKVNLSSVDKISDVSQRSSIVAKKIFENSIRKPFEALGLNPADLNKVTAEAKVKTSATVGRMLTEAELDAVITLPTLDGIVEIQDEIENFDDAEIEFKAEADSTLKTIMAEQEVQNLMTVKADVSNVSADNISKLEINLDSLKNRFVVKNTDTNANASLNSNTLKNDTKKLEVKANAEAKRMCDETIADSKEMCNGDSLCIDIAIATCTKTNRAKIETLTKESANMSFDQILEKAKNEASNIANLVKETHVKFSEKNDKFESFRNEIKNEFSVKIQEEEKKMEERFKLEGKEGGMANFKMNINDFGMQSTIKMNEVKNSLSTNAFLPKELENLLSKEERDLLVKNTVKDESKIASMMKDSQEFMKGGLDSIEKAFSGLFDSDKMKNEMLKQIESDKNLSSKQKAEIQASIKANSNLTPEQQKLVEASMKDSKGLMDQMSKSMENAMSSISGMFGGMASSISSAFGSATSANSALKPDLSKASTDALKSATDLFKSSNLINDAINTAGNITNQSAADLIKAATNTASTIRTDAFNSANLPKNAADIFNTASTIKNDVINTANLPKNAADLINTASTIKTDVINSANLPKNTADLINNTTTLPNFNLNIDTSIGKRFLQSTSSSANLNVNGNEIKVTAEINNGEIKSNVSVNGEQKNEEVKMTLTNTNNNQMTTSVNTNVNTNVKAKNSISLENVPYSFTISNLLGCTQESVILNDFMDNLLALTVDSKTNLELTKEILKLATIIKSFPHPKINRISPLYEELLCVRNFSDKTKVSQALSTLEMESSESPCFLKIDSNGVRTCQKTLVEKTKTSENPRSKSSEVTFICYNKTCAALFERGNNVSLYIKGEISFDVLSAQKKITSSCLSNKLSLEECCHIAGYTDSQKQLAQARLLTENSIEKSTKLCKSEIKEAKSNYKALLTINIPTEASEFEAMVKNLFEGANVTADISVKGRLLTSNDLYVTGSDSSVYSNSKSGLQAESDSKYEVAGSTPSKKATFEESLDTTMTAKAGLQLAESSTSLIKTSILLLIITLLFI